jgi:ParB-like chromosome segregation protein Spo0J
MTRGKGAIASTRGSANRASQHTVEELAPTNEVAVAISALSFGQSPRLVPEDLDHARTLAEVGQALPPILVHGDTKVVIDGRHRVLAARLRGETSIRAQLFHGGEDEAFLLGVRANTTHGKPLSLAERIWAASRILSTKPDLSDRVIASICGLSPHTVATRRTAVATNDQAQRVGADGRTRPLTSRIARDQAAELMLAFPEESNRDIARSVGLSEATVRDVRHEMERAAEVSTEGRDKPVAPMPDSTSRPDESTRQEGAVRGAKRRDRGSQFASWLVAHSISEASWADLVNDVPLSRCPQVIVKAIGISDSWRALAARMERRMREEVT